MESKNWRNDVKYGNFKNAAFSIENNSKSVSSIVYINLLIETNVHLSKSQSDIENVEDLVHFCIVCCKKVTNFTSKHKEKYLGAIFHIYKRLLDFGHFNYVLSLSEFIVHPWSLVSTHKDDHKEIYKSFFAITYNYVHREMTNKIKTDKDIILMKELSITALKFASFAYSDSIDMLEKGCFFICMFEQQYKKFNNIQSQLFYNIFMEIIHYLKSEICIFDKFVENSFKHILNIIVPIITVCLQLSKCHLVATFNEIAPLLKKSDEQNCFFYFEIFFILAEEISFSPSKPCSFQMLCMELEKRNKKNTNMLLHLFCMKMFMFINNIFHNLNEIIEKKLNLNTFWCEFSNFLFILQSILHYAKLEKCKCNSDCLSYTSQKYSIDILKIIIKYTFQSIKCIDSIHIKLNIFKKAFEVIIKETVEIIKLKCSLSSTIIQYIIIMFRNIIINLTELNICKETKKFFLALIKNIFELITIHNMNQSIKKALRDILYTMSLTFTSLQEYKESLRLLAYCILIDKDDKEIIKAWINLKYKSRSDNTTELEGTTIVSLLNENLEHYLPKINIETKELVEIYMLELTAYCDLWPSENHIQVVCIEIMKMSKDPLQKGKVFMLIWNVLSNFVTLKTHLEQTINELLLLDQENSENVEIKIILASTLMCKYQCLINEIRINSSENMDTYYFPITTNQEKLMFEENKSKIFVNVKVEEELLSILNNALDLWSSALEYNVSEDVKNKLLNKEILQMIEMLPAIYELHGHHLHKLKSFSIAYKYAEVLSNVPLMIQFLGRILECLDFNSEEGQTVLKKANNLIKSIKSSNVCNSPDLIKETIMMFRLSESISCFLSKEYKSGYTIFKEVNETYKNFSKVHNRSIGIRIDYLKMKYSGLPCSFDIDDHQNSNFANLKLFYEIKTSFNTTKLLKQCEITNIVILNQMFDFALELGNTYLCLYLPREARCCLRNQILITHSLGLPLRSIQLLNLLSHVDIITSRIEDCQIKLKYINKILCLSNQDENSFNFLNLYSSDNDDFSKIVCLSDFLQHSYNCTCYDCSNILYQQLVLEFFHIGAKLKIIDVKNTSDVYFKEILNIYNKVLCKQKKLINNSNLMFPVIKSENLKTNNSVKVNLSASYFKLLIDYTDMLMQHGNWQDALKKIEEVLKFAYGFEELLCYQVINAIELNCAMLQMNSSNDIDVICENFNTNVIINECNNDDVQVSKLKLNSKNVQNSTHFIDDCNSLCTNVQKSPAHTPVKQNRIIKNKSVSCFKIYTPVIERSTRRTLRSTQKKLSGNEHLTVPKRTVLSTSPDIIVSSPSTKKPLITYSMKKTSSDEDKKRKTRSSVRQKLLQTNILDKNDCFDDIIPLNVKNNK